MKDKELKLNDSGYKDEPCYKAIKAVDVPKPGEIYIHGDTGRYVLVLNCVNGVCAILTLFDQEREGRIPVMARVQMYTNPIMINYAFASSLIQYVKTITDDEFAVIRNAVANALNVEHIYVGLEPMGSGIHPDFHEREVKKLTDENNALKHEMGLMKNELEAREKARILLDESFEKVSREADKAEIYKEMYMTLLDKVISARGCVNE